MQSEKIKPILTSLGFFSNPVSDEWSALEFSYEGINFLFLPDDDEKCIMMAVPNIFGVDDENRMLVYEKVNELSNLMKFLKPSIVSGESVWLSYEHFLGSNEPTEEVVEHMIKLLGAGFVRFHGLMNSDDEDDAADHTNNQINEEEDTEDE